MERNGLYACVCVRKRERGGRERVHAFSYIYIYIYIYIYDGESKANTLFFITGKLIDTTRMYVIHQNGADLLWITSLILDIVAISLYSYDEPSNENMCPKSCQSIISSFCIKMLDHTQASGQEK